MIMSELVSVVITSYNAGKYLEQCIESVLQQTYSNIEILIVNDGSTDNTDEIARKYAAREEKIRYFYQDNSGVSVARNLGISNAAGRNIMFVDGDDYLDEHIIERLSEEMGDSDIICCCCKAFDRHGTYEDLFFSALFTAKTQTEKEKLYLQLLNGNSGKPNGKGYTAIGVPWGKLYRLDFLKKNKIFFDQNLKRMQDNMFNMYAFWYAKEIIYLNEPLYFYRLAHIRSKKTSYGLEIWQPFLNARREFIKNHKGILTSAVENGLFYELNIGYISLMLHISQNKTFLTAVREMSGVRKNELFSPLFASSRKQAIPLKIEVIRLLSKINLYPVIISTIKIRQIISNGFRGED